MATDATVRRVVSALVGVYVLAVLLWGLFVVQQIALAVLLSVVGALVGGLAYAAWGYRRAGAARRGG